MNTMRRFCAASLLALTLTLSASAGIIHFPATQPPPPPSEPATNQEGGTTDPNGDIHFGLTDESHNQTDSTLEAALSLLRVVLSLI